MSDSRVEFEQFRDERNRALKAEGHKNDSPYLVTNAHYATWQAARNHKAEPVAKVQSIDPVACTAVVTWTPKINGGIPQAIDRIGADLYALPTASEQCEQEGWLTLPEDLFTHIVDFENAVKLAIESTGDPDGYWLHQLETLKSCRVAAAHGPSGWGSGQLEVNATKELA